MGACLQQRSFGGMDVVGQPNALGLDPGAQQGEEGTAANPRRGGRNSIGGGCSDTGHSTVVRRTQ